MNDSTLTEFFTGDYPSFAAYDNVRKMCSFVDGLKLSQRKAIYTFLKRFPNPTTESKTARLASSIAECTEYIHGEASLTGVLDSMAASFIGSNNYPLVIGHGNFGSRFAGAGSAASPRYTYCSIAPLTLKLFGGDDNALCPSQLFEGSEIEPKFFMPIYPIILLNGNEGLTSGWRMQIYPRNPSDVIKYITDVLRGKKPADPNKFIPYFKDFKGTTKIEHVTRPDGTVDQVFVNYGIIEKVNNTSLKITELPISYNYASYINVLTKLVDSGIIVDYDDHSDPKSDTFYFDIKVARTFFNTYSDLPSWIQVFKLSKTLTEQLNCIDVNNAVVEFGSIKDILDAFIKIRLEYYNTRRAYLINKYQQQIDLNTSRLIWCTGIINDTIKIRNVAKADIIAQLENNKQIIKKDDSYNYLLNMPLTSVTHEKLVELKASVAELIAMLQKISATSDADFMTTDLTDIQKHLS